MPSIIVNGMSCNHCRQTVQKAIAAVAGVESVDVDLEKKTATWTEASPVNTDAVCEAVRAIGFDPE